MRPTASNTVYAEINYVGDMAERPWFHANDRSFDRLNLDPRVVTIVDGRSQPEPPSLQREGIALCDAPTSVRDFRDAAEVERTYPEETRRFIQELTGADAVVVAGNPILRFGERSAEAGGRDNSRAARLVHIDTSDLTAGQFAERSRPTEGRRIRRVAQHNIWRAFSEPPQDVPLAVCDARTVAAADLVPADARFDRNGEIVFSFEALLLRHRPAHRWLFFPDMRRDEALVFKRNDTDPAEPHWVPHSAFTHPLISSGVPPRASVEIRTIAYWYE